MGAHIRRALLAAALLSLWASASAQTAPAATEASICRPTFQAGDTRYVAGTAFLLDVGTADQTLLVTATHLFGPAGGLDAEISWDQLPARVRMTDCKPYRSTETWRTAPPLAIPGAHPGFDRKTMLDVAAFPVTDKVSAPRLRFAAQAPAVGDSVWLVAEIIAEPIQPGLLHHAVVSEITDHALIITYDHPLGIMATSGAPIVDAHGDVVGVNFGGGMRSEMIGLATSWTAIRAALGPKPQ